MSDILINQLKFQLGLLIISILFKWCNDISVKEAFWFWLAINLVWYGGLLIYLFVLWKGGRFFG